MKKLFFTAIVMIAFTSVSTANPSQLKSLHLLTANTLSSKKVDNANKKMALDCSGFAYHMTAAVEELNGCMSSSDYNISIAYWSAMCVIMTP